MATFGEMVRTFRRRENLTQETLADTLGVHRNSISDWERSAYRPRSREMVLYLSEALALDPADTDQLLLAAHYPSAYNSQASIDYSWSVVASDIGASDELADVQRSVFVAREDELGQLDTFLADVLNDQKGCVIFVTGEAGSGKTALVQEFAWRALETHSELVVAGGSCNAYSGIGDPYLPFREILGLLTYGSDTRWATEAFVRKFSHRLRSLVPYVVRALVDTGPNLIETFISGSALIARAEAIPSDDTYWLDPLKNLVSSQSVAQISANSQQRNLFEQYTQVMRLLAHQVPLLLVLDDLQWADAGSIGLLFHLGKRLKDRPILIIGAYRPADMFLGRDGKRHPLEPVVNEFQRDFGRNRIDLRQAMGKSFIEALLDTEPNRFGEDFREALYQHTRGHALFTTEILRSMQRRGDIVKDETDLWIEGPTLDWKTLPARVDGVIRERIERLPQDLQKTLKVASVEGEDFLAEVIAKLHTVDEWAMVQQLSDILDRQHRLVSSQTTSRLGIQRLSRYRFRHILFQHYLYHRLDNVEQAFLHEMVGNTLEQLYAGHTEAIAIQLARHFQKAEIKNKAVIYLTQAGKRAMRLSANEEAVVLFTKALTLLTTSPEMTERAALELDIQTSLGPALIAIKGYAAKEVESAYTRAQQLCRKVENASRVFPVLVGLWLHYFVRGELRRALELGQQLLQLARNESDPVVLLQAHRTLGSTYYSLGEFQPSLRHCDQGIALYRSHQPRYGDTLAYVHDPGVVCLAYSSLSLWCLGFPDQGLKRSHESIALAQEINHPFSHALALGTASFFHHLRREKQKAHERATAALAIASDKGFSQWIVVGTILIGWSSAQMGLGAEGIAPMRQALDGWRRSGAKLVVPYFLFMLAETYSVLEHAENALTTLEEALSVAYNTGERWLEAEMHRLRGEILLKKGASEKDIETCFNQALDIACHQNAKMLELRATVSLSQLWQRQGRRSEMLQNLTKIYDWFTEGFETKDLRAARALLDGLD